MPVIHQRTSPVLENCKSGYQSVSQHSLKHTDRHQQCPHLTPLTEGETTHSKWRLPPSCVFSTEAGN